MSGRITSAKGTGAGQVGCCDLSDGTYVVVTAPNRSRPDAAATQPLRRGIAGWRPIVETVPAALLGVCRLEHERPHRLVAGFQARLAAKGGPHTCCHWLNRRLGRPPLALADLLDL